MFNTTKYKYLVSLNKFASYILIFSNKTLFFHQDFCGFPAELFEFLFIVQERMVERHSCDSCDFVKSQAERLRSVFFYNNSKVFRICSF